MNKNAKQFIKEGATGTYIFTDENENGVIVRAQGAFTVQKVRSSDFVILRERDGVMVKCFCALPSQAVDGSQSIEWRENGYRITWTQPGHLAKFTHSHAEYIFSK